MGSMFGVGSPSTKSPQEILAEQEAYLDAFNNSSIGQQYNEREKSASQRAREMADFDMDMKRQDLQMRANALKQQGKIDEANLLLKKGELELARERLAVETQIKQAELGLSTAKTYAEFSSGPDMMFMQGDFIDGMNRIAAGRGPRPYGATGTPQMRTFADFEASMNGQWDGNNGSGGGGAGAKAQVDPRVKAAKGVLDAIPPSDDDGMDESDEAALAAVQNIIKARRPGTLARMRPGQRAGFRAGASKLGLWAPDVEADLVRSGIGQGSNRSY